MQRDATESAKSHVDSRGFSARRRGGGMERGLLGVVGVVVAVVAVGCCMRARTGVTQRSCDDCRERY